MNKMNIIPQNKTDVSSVYREKINTSNRILHNLQILLQQKNNWVKNLKN